MQELSDEPFVGLKLLNRDISLTGLKAFRRTLCGVEADAEEIKLVELNHIFDRQTYLLLIFQMYLFIIEVTANQC